MACFLVTVAEAIIVTAVTQAVRSKEKKSAADKSDSADSTAAEQAAKIPFSKKLSWLRNLLWGGSFLLAYEHVWHGEVVPWFPFLTAAGNPGDAEVMLHEMATVGTSMAVLITAVWAGMVLTADLMAKKSVKTAAAAKNGGGV